MEGQKGIHIPRIVVVKTMVQRFTYTVLMLVALGLMLMARTDPAVVDRIRAKTMDMVAPVLDVVSRPVAAIEQLVQQTQSLFNLRAENIRLQEDNERLLSWQSAARVLEAENAALRSLLVYAPDPSATFVSARVIGDPGGAFAHSLIVNAGARDGVRKGLAVVTGDGLVGRISNVGDSASRVLLIADLNSRVPVLLERTRTRAILVGDNNERPILTRLPAGVTVALGERIVTSGHAGAFPPGLPVGTVVSVSDGLITVRPFVNRHRLEMVRIIDYGLTGIIEPTKENTAVSAK